MFYDVSGEVYRQVLKEDAGDWLISYEHPVAPRFVMADELKNYEHIEPPAEYLKCIEKEATDGRKKRLGLISDLIEDKIYISDKRLRNEKIKEIAERERTTVKRIQKLFYRYLAGRSLIEERQVSVKDPLIEKKEFVWAINTFYYSAKKVSLRTAYDLMLLSKYTDADGHLMMEYPSWHCFRHYFYDKNYHRKSRNSISRNGLSNYQRNQRPLFGSAMEWKDKIGAYQMDATQADIYLVSRLDKSAIIGRPNIYMAVDTATQLIAGIHIGLEAGEDAVIQCLSNAAMDKVSYCNQYGIEIKKEDWPSAGLPSEIITDKGKEFIGNRMGELSMRYGIEFEALPPFRPDGKGLVEKSFDLLQQKYKPVLRGKGVIEPDAAERWATDYRSQATLTLKDFTKVVIHCVLYLNRCRILQSNPIKEAPPVPAKIWSWYVDQNKSMLIPIDGDTLYQFGLRRKAATLSRKGINHNGLWYASSSLKTLLENNKIGQKITIAYDTEDISKIYLIDGMSYVPFALTQYNQQYAGVTEIELVLEKEHLRTTRQALETIDTEGRIELLQNIQSIVGGTQMVDKDKIEATVIKKNRMRELI